MIIRLPVPRSVRLVAGIAALNAGLLAAPFLLNSAHADIVLDRSMPIVFLSDGHRVQLTTTTYDAQSDIKSVAYTVHVPAGVTVTRVLDTESPANALLDTVQVYTDNAPGWYDASVTVSTRTPGISSTFDVRVPSVGAGSATGTSGSSLQVHVGSRP